MKAYYTLYDSLLVGPGIVLDLSGMIPWETVQVHVLHEMFF